ncbi:MAG: histidine phosphatase family protein [Candidatus Heimdallarchaeota archaeon]
MNKRIKVTFEEIVKKTDENSTIMIITHGGVLGRLLKSILKFLPEDRSSFKINS